MIGGIGGGRLTFGFWRTKICFGRCGRASTFNAPITTRKNNTA